MSSYQMMKESTQLGKGKNQDLQRSKPNTMRDQHHEERKKDSTDMIHTQCKIKRAENEKWKCPRK